jgi:hypothetical protein
MASAASRRAVGMTCEYRSIVIAICECPRVRNAPMRLFNSLFSA